MSTLLGESFVAKSLYRNHLIILPNRVSYVELVELYIRYFDIIFGMDWLHSFFDSINCWTRVVKFKFPNEPLV